MRTLIIIFLFISNFAIGQVTIEKALKISAEKVYTDNYDNFYVLNDNILTKYNKEGNKIGSFSSENGKEISFVDTKNPQKVLVFFKNDNEIQLLDSHLSQLNKTISLNELNIFNDALINVANIGGYWVFDQTKKQLLKLNEKFKLEYTKNINTNSKIISMNNNSEDIFFMNNSGGLLAYNINTNNIIELPVYKLFSNFIIIEDNIVCYQSNIHGLKFQNIITGKSKSIKLPKKVNITNAVIGNQKIFFFNKTKLYISNTPKKQK